MEVAVGQQAETNTPREQSQHPCAPVLRVHVQGNRRASGSGRLTGIGGGRQHQSDDQERNNGQDHEPERLTSHETSIGTGRSRRARLLNRGVATTLRAAGRSPGPYQERIHMRTRVTAVGHGAYGPGVVADRAPKLGSWQRNGISTRTGTGNVPGPTTPTWRCGRTTRKRGPSSADGRSSANAPTPNRRRWPRCLTACGRQRRSWSAPATS